MLPVPVPVSQTDKSAAELKLFNASLWRRWKTIDEHHRLLEASLEELVSPQLPEWVSRFPESEKIATAFEFQPRSELERLDVIASERFETRMVQTFQEMLLTTNVRKVVPTSSVPKVELLPHGILSVDEAHAGTMLGQYLGLRLDQTKAGTLLLSERL